MISSLLAAARELAMPVEPTVLTTEAAPPRAPTRTNTVLGRVPRDGVPNTYAQTAIE